MGKFVAKVHYCGMYVSLIISVEVFCSAPREGVSELGTPYTVAVPKRGRKMVF
jgi:hypothetical protein